MRRRDFMTLVGGAATALPLTGRAQSEEMRRICVLMGFAESDPAQKALIAAFTNALKELGWQDGRNVLIDRRARLARSRCLSARGGND